MGILLAICSGVNPEGMDQIKDCYSTSLTSMGSFSPALNSALAHTAMVESTKRRHASLRQAFIFIPLGLNLVVDIGFSFKAGQTPMLVDALQASRWLCVFSTRFGD